MKILSLFANIGVAEANLEKLKFDVVLANEIDPKRVDIYSKLYPSTEMICGDITDNLIMNEIILKAKKYDVDIIMATPPCQGMSTAGKMKKNDKRNELIKYVIKAVEDIMPKYAMIENVPTQMITKIEYDDKQVLIPDYIKICLGENYSIEQKVINVCKYGVPQSRERVIFLLTRADQEKKWEFPIEDNEVVTLQNAIGHLPKLDPYIKDVEYSELLEIFPKYEENKAKALSISKWHSPPEHVHRQIIAMMHTPTGETAFNNNKFKYRPTKKNGEAVKGYKNTYKRQRWDLPAYTVTMYNRTISSQNNTHPGRFLYVNDDGDEVYSDPRVLTLYEIMLVMSIPDNWNIPDGVSESYLRSIIGEGIPPLFIEKLYKKLL